MALSFGDKVHVVYVSSGSQDRELLDALLRKGVNVPESNKAQFVNTALGCRVWVRKAPEHFREGVMLELRMPPRDGRNAEVYLSQENVSELIEALEAFETL